MASSSGFDDAFRLKVLDELLDVAYLRCNDRAAIEAYLSRQLCASPTGLAPAARLGAYPEAVPRSSS